MTSSHPPGCSATTTCTFAVGIEDTLRATGASGAPSPLDEYELTGPLCALARKISISQPKSGRGTPIRYGKWPWYRIEPRRRAVFRVGVARTGSSDPPGRGRA